MIWAITSRVSLIAFPLSMASTVAINSSLASIVFATVFKTLLLSEADVLLQVIKAFSAVSMANSTSSTVDLATLVNTFPSIGDNTSSYFPFTGVMNLPPINNNSIP